MKAFSAAWKKSKQRRKQRKYRYNAPLHIKQKFIGAHMSRELRQKYGKRSAGLRKGDVVKVLRGKFRKKTGRVDRVDLKRNRIYIIGIEAKKRDGTKAFIPINPSKVMITELNIDDKQRQKKF